MNEKEYQKLMEESDRCETVALKMKNVNLKTFYHNASVGFKNKALALDLYTVDNTTYNNTTCNDYSNTSVVDNHLSATTKFIAELLLAVLIISTLMITSIL